jgi:hypothetical protein
MLFQERGKDSISNLYTIKVANKTIRQVPLILRMEDMSGSIEVIGGGPILLKREEEGSGTFFVVIPRNLLRERKTGIRIGLYEGHKRIDEIRTNFLGPLPDNDND